MTTVRATLPIGDELLDHPDADPAIVEESLRHIARSNRWFGGWWAVRYGLDRLLAGQTGNRFTLLDIGTGLGDMPAAAARWASSRGIALVPLGVDRHRTAAALASTRGVPTIVGCASRLAVGQGRVDIVIVSQVLHHFPGPAIVELLAELNRIARLGVVVADIRRSRLAQAGFWIGSRLLAFDPATRRDGITSVRRGFSSRELQRLLEQAGIEARVERRPGFRLVACWRIGGGVADG